MLYKLIDCYRAGELLFTLGKAYPKGMYHGYDISAKSLAIANAR